MQIQVVEADYEDPTHCEGILDVLDSYAADPVGGGTPLSTAVRARLIPLLREHPSSFVLLALADADARVVGVAVCFVNLSTFRARPVLNVGDLAVLPELRGRGVGRALLTRAEERAHAQGCCRLTLEVQQDNRRALALYESFGFEDLIVGDSEPTRFLIKPLESHDAH